MLPKNPCSTFVALVASAVLLACGPSIDQAAKVDIDRRVAVLLPTGQAFPPPTANAPRPLAVGQWTQHKLLDEKGEPSLMTYKVVGEEGDAIWLEVASEGYFGKTVTKMLVYFGDRSHLGTMEIRAVKLKDKNGRVTELQGPMIALMRSLWQGSVSMLLVSWQGLPQEDARVVAGNFSACFKARTDASWGPWHAATIAWSHPLVPVSGLVKSVGLDRPTSMELVGFGDIGATSEIP